METLLDLNCLFRCALLNLDIVLVEESAGDARTYMLVEKARRKSPRLINNDVDTKGVKNIN